MPDPYREITEEERTTREGWPLKREPLPRRPEYRGVQKVPEEKPEARGLDAPQVGDSYFLHDKQVIADDLGGSQEVGPGFVTPWSKLNKSDQFIDIKQVIKGERNDFGEHGRYINQLWREYGGSGASEYKDIENVTEEFKNMIDKGLLPDFYMTISDRPFEDQLEQFERIQAAGGPLAEAMPAMPERVGRIEAAREAEAFPGRVPTGHVD
jgi:hypothetical protein